MEAQRGSRLSLLGSIFSRALIVSFVCGALWVSAPAHGQYASNFDALNGSPTGVVLTGQDGYYLPAGVTSVDYEVYTYAGNDLGIAANPCGGTQFIAGTGPGDGTTYARAQRDITWGTGIWEVQYDMLGQFVAEPPSANNLGSFSVQPFPGSANFLHLASWVDPATATNWNSWYMPYDADGTQFAQPGLSPGPEWDDLELNHWYRFTTVVDFDLNQVIEVRTVDLETGVAATFTPTGWYLEGGSSGAPTPTGFRFFAGGGTGSANTLAWDNIIIRQPCDGDLNGDGVVDVEDLLLLLGGWGGPCGDADGDGTTDVTDLLLLLGAWGAC